MNDSVLKKIALQMRIKQVKVENISRALGISAGEFSKVINGQRKQYHKHLPGIAAYLNVDLHELSASDAGGKSDHIAHTNCPHCAQENAGHKPEHFEAILQSKNELIASLKEILKLYEKN